MMVKTASNVEMEREEKDDKIDRDGRTALMLSAQYGHTECVQALLDAGDDKDKLDIDGRTALMLAARYGHTECVEALLDAGTDKDKIDIDGRTALMLAARYGHTGCVEALRAKSSATAKSLAATSGKSNPSTLDGAAQNGSEGERSNDDIAAQEIIPEPKLPPISAPPIPDIKPQQDSNASPHLPAISLVQDKSKIATKLLVGDEKKGELDWLANILDRAQRKWLNSDDILKIMARYREIEQQDGLWPEKAARHPQGGDIFIFSRKLCPNFRADGHTFDKKKSEFGCVSY
jgi:ankyrin repeat protein